MVFLSVCLPKPIESFHSKRRGPLISSMPDQMTAALRRSKSHANVNQKLAECLLHMQINIYQYLNCNVHNPQSQILVSSVQQLWTLTSY